VHTGNLNVVYSHYRYGHFPELAKIVTDSYMYAKVAKYVKSHKDLTKDMLKELEEIFMDSSKLKL